MTEFAQRVLSRRIAQSTVLIISDSLLENWNSVPLAILNKAVAEGHTHHVITRTIQNDHPVVRSTMDEWWSVVTRDPHGSAVNGQLSNWYLLTLFEDDGLPIFSSYEAGLEFLQGKGPTMTYIVLGVTASMINFEDLGYTNMDTVRLLLDSNYKVQLLSATDFWNLNGTVFNPNDLITHENLELFFEWGAKSAAISKEWLKEVDTVDANYPIFKAYLFATQGLDLAIPSRSVYMAQNNYVPQTRWNFPFNLAEKFDERQKMVENVQSIYLKRCGGGKNMVFKLLNTEVQTNDNIWNSIQVSCYNQDVTEAVKAKRDLVEVVLSNTDRSKQEAICIKLDCQALIHNTIGTQEISCATRIVPHESLRIPDSKNEESNEPQMKPNILMVMIDPISRPQFEFTMPLTKQLVTSTEQQLNFARFSRYTTVGDNSGPNQAALYAGHKLDSRNVISDVNSWIWDDLNRMGYATFKAEDGCIANSNMVQSMQPNTTHGHALRDLYCVDFERPNCVGGKHASEYLFEHTKDFIHTYSSSPKTPWAAFISLVDTHEDTNTLASILDQYLESFFKEITNEMASTDTLKNTAILLVSDHGLHYGPYFQSLEGERERSEPVLYMKLPETMHEGHIHNEYLRSNLDKWITPYDVHETLLDIINGGIPHNSPSPMDAFRYGSSLIQGVLPFDSCRGRDGLIPDRHCKLVDPLPGQEIPREIIPTPPAMLSFFGDIPKDHRLKDSFYKSPGSDAESLFRMSADSGRACKCATSHRDWYECNQHPRETVDPAQNYNDEYFFLIGCEGFRVHLEFFISPESQSLLKVSQVNSINALKRGNNNPPPSILYIEIDSVSIDFADRHLPRTRELLKKYRRTEWEADGSHEPQCHNGLCGINFSKVALNGPSSMPNQVAALSGCFNTLLYPGCFTEEPKLGDICQDPKRPEYGMRLHSFGKALNTEAVVYCPTEIPNPFLFDVGKEEGYFNFFGEEFCYEGSRWVFQDNIFPLQADIKLDQIYCRLSKYLNLGWYDMDKAEVDTTKGLNKQEWPLELLHQMWTNLPPKTPKLAYYNAIAAHNTEAEEYSRLAGKAEVLDNSLASFLESIFSGEEAQNTIIVIRSDHGSQCLLAMDYSTQIERSRPWTEVIVPEGFPGLQNLRTNSDKLVTPLDLSVMFRRLMTGKVENDSSRTGNYDLLNEVVPDERTCADARIPTDFCFKEFVPFPTYYICNPFENNQASLCKDPYLGTRSAQ